MKQYITLSMVLMALVLVGCAREESFSEREGGEIVTIKAVIAENKLTKTVIQEGATSVLWEPAEEISVFFKGVGNKFTSQNTELAAVADFTGTFSAIVGANEGAGASNLIWGLYPYRSDASSDGASVTTSLPSSQKGRAGSFAQNTQITLAASTGLNLAFYNVTGGLRFSLTREDIKSVSFEGNKKEPLAGTVKLAFSDGIPVVTEVLDSVGRITLNAPNGGAFQSGVWYYIVALPAELSEGFTLSFNTGSSVGSRRSNNAVTVKRGIFGSIAEVDKGVVFYAVPDAVDLGLPSGTLWASFNVGANSPEEIGGRYAWGETETKSSYTWSNYKWCNGSSSSFTKYCTADGKTKLDDEDDVVQVKFGDGWHMPDNSQIQELLSKCTWTSVTLNGVNGYRVTGPNSNTIFFPCNGQWEDSGLVYSSRVYIWSSECYANANTNAYRLQYPNSTDWGYNHKHDGLCVRAVKGKSNEEFHPFEPEYVDLGLSVKWATCNLGAETPEDYGDYYSWGEIIPKDEYSWSTYIWCNGDYNKLTKYCPTNKTDYWDGTETPEGKTVLDLEDDAARANWGVTWRIPTDAEWTELREKCTWTWTTQKGVNGRLVTSNINGNSIFLPAAGLRADTSLSNVGSDGGYWPSSLDSDYPDLAWYVYFDSSDVYRSSYGRYHGLSVRPVYGEYIYVNDVILSDSSLTMIIGEALTLSATVTPSNATEKSVLWESSDESVATVDGSGLVTAVAVGTAIITAKTVDGSNKTASCSVEVKEEEISATDVVDLGLSVKWATCNVGADKLEGCGDYFAWGETDPTLKDLYDWSNYKWMVNGGFTKYCNYTDYGTVDNIQTLDFEDDAARANRGGSWRMPTDEEWTELRENCTLTWSTLNGVNGGWLTSNINGKRIFLPAAGTQHGTNLHDMGIVGFYWSSSLNSGNDYYAWGFSLNSSDVYRDSDDRYRGRSIRPVYDGNHIQPEEQETINLSERGTANCYIISNAGNYKFRGDVKGSSSENVGSPVSAQVLWESYGTTEAPAAGSIIQSASFADGYVFLNTPEELKNGNAVIAVKDADGNVLWSWHIWVCNGYVPAETDQELKNGAGIMMDRNLGSLSITPGDVECLGLLYQWGRKDPFLGAGKTSYSSSSNQEKASSSVTWPTPVASSSESGTETFTVAHPMTFVTQNSSNYDWYYGTGGNRWTRRYSEKSVQDPCPVGYRVPDGGSSGVWETAGYTSALDQSTMTMRVYILQSGQYATYPAAGFLKRESGALNYAGYNGLMWSATSSYDGMAYYMDYSLGSTSMQTYNAYKADARPVRCVRMEMGESL